MLGEVQKKDGGMGSEEVRYATGDMMSGEDQIEDRCMGSEEVRYATGEMMTGGLRIKMKEWDQRR